MSRFDVRSRLALAAVPASAVVLLDELVLWAGQPAGDPTKELVAAWYDVHATRILLGDMLWLAACGLLVAVLWTAATAFPLLPRWTVRAVGLGATTSLAVSSLFAAQIALGLPDDALSAWHLEGVAYRAGCVLLALSLVPFLDGLVALRRRALVAPLALAGVALALPATSVFGLAAAFPLVAFALLPDRRRPAAAPTLDAASDAEHSPSGSLFRVDHAA